MPDEKLELKPGIALASEWAAIYRERGFNPLPSRTDAKRPCCRFAEWWKSLGPNDLFEMFPTTNIQVMTGRHWRLLVIDLDGPEAIERWKTMGPCPRTWTVHSGGCGRHLWFRLPIAYQFPLPKAVLWKGSGDHQAIERLCDHSLVMAPPSIHPVTEHRYRFLVHHSPVNLTLPADCPGWILAAKPIVREVPFPRVHIPTFDRPRDPIGLARSWGVRLAGPTSASGWIPCHAIDREDRHPSAAIQRENGFYIDHGSGERLSLIDLSIRLGIYRDVREAIRGLSHA